MRETGDFSALNETFVTDNHGEYPGAGTSVYVEGLKAQYETTSAYIEEYPNYPVSSKIVERIDSIESTGFQEFTVDGVELELTYGAPDKDGNVWEFRSATRKQWRIMGIVHEINEGVTETAWAILSEMPMGSTSRAEEDFGQD